VNGNPSAKQKAYHLEIREMFYDLYTTKAELHHVFGSKFKAKLLKECGIDKPGEWFVIMLSKDDHDSIGKFTFESERGLFLQQQRDYARYFEKKSPVPNEVIDYYNKMTGKHQGLKSW